MKIRWIEIYSIFIELSTNLVPKLSSLRSSLEKDTLVNAGHVVPRFWEQACEGLWVYVVFASHLMKSVTRVTFTQKITNPPLTSNAYPNGSRNLCATSPAFTRVSSSSVERRD